MRCEFPRHIRHFYAYGSEVMPRRGAQDSNYRHAGAEGNFISAGFVERYAVFDFNMRRHIIVAR